MTDNLLEKVEEKVVSLLNELDNLRKEVSSLKHENAALKSEQGNHTKKLHSLISLLDILDATNEPTLNKESIAAV